MTAEEEEEQAYLPRPSAAGSLCASFVPPGVVLSNPPLRIHREADVDAAFEFWVGAVKHVHTVEAFHLHYHYLKKKKFKPP